MRKKIITSIIATLLLLLLIASLILTPTGLRISLNIANVVTSQHIKFHTISGTVLGPLNIDGLEYQHKNLDIKINKLSLDWSFSDFIKKKININKLAADGVTITHNKSNNIINLPKIPQYLTIKKIKIHNIEFINDNRQIIKPINIEGSINFNPNTVSSSLLVHSIHPTPWHSSIKLSGTPDNAKFKIISHIKKKTWTIQGQKRASHITFNTESELFLSGKIAASGSIDLNSNTWLAQLKGTNIDLSQIQSNLAKNINIQIDSKGTLINQKKLASDNTIILHSKKNNLSIHLVTNRTEQENSFHADWQTKSSEIDQLTNLFSGDLQSSGSATLTNGLFKTTGKLTSNHFSTDTVSFQNLESTWSLQQDEKKAVQLSATASRIHHNNTTINQATLKLTGSLLQHILKISADTNGVKTQMIINGKLKNKNWSAEASKVELKSNGITIENKKKLAFNLSESNLTVDPFCLYNSSGSTVCSGFKVNANKRWSGTINATKFPYQFFNPVLPFNLQGKANVTINGEFQGSNKTVHSASFKATIRNASLNNMNTAISQRIKYINSDIQLKNNDFHSTNRAVIDNQNAIQFDVNVSNITSSQPIKKTVSGTVAAKLSNIAFINDLFPSINILKGKLTSQLILSGSLDQPKVNGELHIKEAQIYTPQLGLMLKNISSSLSSDNTTLKSKTVFNIDSKPLVITSTTNLNSPVYQTQGTIKGDSVLLYNLPQYTVYASPDVNFTATTKGINLLGRLTIPKATIKPIQNFAAITLPQEDIIYVNGPDITQTKFTYAFDIYTTLGENINLNLHGIKGQVSGKLNLKKQRNHPIFASGDISVVKGTYQIYGNQLRIEKNSALLFSNTLITQPNLSITASKTIKRTSPTSIKLSSATYSQASPSNNITVGIKVTGNISRPELTLYSIPASLNQAQILSYLVLGYSTENTDSDSSSGKSIVNAINALKLAQSGLSSSHGTGFIDTIRSSLGLAELDINTQTSSDALGNTIDNTPQTSFVVGKYITDRFYLKYIQDLSSLTPIKVFQAILKITPRWSLQASTSISSDKSNPTSPTSSNNYYNGLDLIYSINKK